MKKTANKYHWDQQIKLPNGETTSGRWLPCFEEYGLTEIEFKSKKVLDIGCLNGQYSFYAERMGGTVTSIDITESKKTNHFQGNSCDSYIYAHKQFKSKAKYLFPYSVYDIENLGKFDVVLFLGVFYHLVHPLLAIEKINSVLKIGGVMTLETEISNFKTRFYHKNSINLNIEQSIKNSFSKTRLLDYLKHFLSRPTKYKKQLIVHTLGIILAKLLNSITCFIFPNNVAVHRNDPSNFWVMECVDIERILDFYGFKITKKISAFPGRITYVCRKVKEVNNIYSSVSKYSNYKNRITN